MLVNFATREAADRESCDNMTEEEVHQFLHGSLFSLMHDLNRQLLERSLEEKRKALTGLVGIMYVSGASNLADVRVKVLGLIKLSLGNPQLVPLALRVLNTFVRLVHRNILGSLLSQLVVTALQALNEHPDQVSSILSYLIIDNRALLRDHFKDLFYMPEHPAIDAVNIVLRAETRKAAAQATLRDRIRRILPGVGHESLQLRLLALDNLRDLLRTQRQAVSQLVLASTDSMDDTVSDLLQALLNGAREEDPVARRLYGECLGQVGAIDPGRVGSLGPQAKNSFAGSHTIVNAGVAVQLLETHLARALLTAEDTNSQDQAALAIQVGTVIAFLSVPAPFSLLWCSGSVNLPRSSSI